MIRAQRLALVGALVVVVGGLSVACDASSQTLVLSASASDGVAMTITYDVDEGSSTGPRKADATGAWSKTLTVKDPNLITVAVTNSGGQGTVLCAIKVDGRVVDTHHVNGAYQTATCAHT